MTKTKIKRPVLITAVIFGLAMNIFLAEEGLAKKKEEPIITDPVTVSKTIRGEIGVRRDEYITVIYKEDKKSDGTITKDYEMVLPIDENVTLSHIGGADQLNEGDAIEIQFDETSWIDENGIGRIKRRGKHIRFIKTALKGFSSR